MASVELHVEHGNVKTFVADVLVLKYAQGGHGADRAVSHLLERAGLDPLRMQPDDNEVVVLRLSLIHI